MEYSIDWLKLQTNFEFFFFWGHQASKGGSLSKACLSQWWKASFKEENIIYKTAEHYMMAQKAKLFNDNEIFEKILNTESPKDVKELGREIRNFESTKWDEKKSQIVAQGNYLKFSQNEELKQFLIQTKNKVIAEASPVDPIWGIGLAEDNPKALNPFEWRGENLLGFALMAARDRLNIK